MHLFRISKMKFLIPWAMGRAPRKIVLANNRRMYTQSTHPSHACMINLSLVLASWAVGPGREIKMVKPGWTWCEVLRPLGRRCSPRAVDWERSRNQVFGRRVFRIIVYAESVRHTLRVIRILCLSNAEGAVILRTWERNEIC